MYQVGLDTNPHNNVKVMDSMTDACLSPVIIDLSECLVARNDILLVERIRSNNHHVNESTLTFFNKNILNRKKVYEYRSGRIMSKRIMFSQKNLCLLFVERRVYCSRERNV